MRVFTSLVFVCLAQSGLADPLGLVDYDRLFIKNENIVEVADNGDLVLKMPGNVALLRQQSGASGNITAVDFSKIGAVGCAASLYASIEAVAQTCDGAFSSEQVEHLITYRDELLDYYADNTYPAASRASVQVAYDAYVARVTPAGPEFCKTFGGDRKMFYNFMTSDQMRPEFDALLSEPRLPVGNPCL